MEIKTTSRTERNFFMMIASFYGPMPYALAQNVSEFGFNSAELSK